MRISDWSSDVCSSDLFVLDIEGQLRLGGAEALWAQFDRIVRHCRIEREHVLRGEAQPRAAARECRQLLRGQIDSEIAVGIAAAQQIEFGTEDRKSTRLNSSH